MARRLGEVLATLALASVIWLCLEGPSAPFSNTGTAIILGISALVVFCVSSLVSRVARRKQY